MTMQPRKLSEEQAQRLALAAEPWLSCDDCFEQIDGLVDSLLAGTPAGFAALRSHLLGCAACGEEARALVLLVAAEDGLDPRPALRSLTLD
ncbi:hypothetical protein [Arthrobacter sp. 35W]|uniref:hypothetical protein n=1 Tax=Arthrobacter sp. 35W TaxID=1132441 RepID=UPI00041C2AA7|nr:hypothetical protein [Arthrobacter sp. 35W]